MWLYKWTMLSKNNQLLTAILSLFFFFLVCLFNLVLLSSQGILFLSHVKGDGVREVEAHRRVTGEILHFCLHFLNASSVSSSRI